MKRKATQVEQKPGEQQPRVVLVNLERTSVDSGSGREALVNSQDEDTVLLAKYKSSFVRESFARAKLLLAIFITLSVVYGLVYLRIEAATDHDWQPKIIVVTCICCCALLIILQAAWKPWRAANKDSSSRTWQVALLMISMFVGPAMAMTLGKQFTIFNQTLIFILYTQLAFPSDRTANLVILGAILVHVISIPIIHYNVNDNQRQWLALRGWIQAAAILAYYLSTRLVCDCLNKLSLKEIESSFRDIKEHVQYKMKIHSEDQKLTKLMESVIPPHLVERMREDILKPKDESNFYKLTSESHDNVSILFADIVNFTKISSNLPADELVKTLNELFGRFDKAADKNSCLRIKILGDCYYCVSGIPKNDSHAKNSVLMALDIIDILKNLAQDNKVDLNMRVGIHSGRIICSILGKKKWQYDVHSNDVKLANQLEQSGVPGKIHISIDTKNALKDEFETEEAFGEKRNSYIAEQQKETFYIIPPSTRPRRSLELSSCSNDNSSSDQKPSLASSQVASTKSAQGLKSIAKFRGATRRVINALNFINTIEAPFSNIVAHDDQIESEILRASIENRASIRNDINRYTLEFKSPQMRKLYSESYADNLAQQLVRLILCLVLLLDTLMAFPIVLLDNGSKLDKISATIICQIVAILVSAAIALLAYYHQTEYNSRRDFLWRQTAGEDQEKMKKVIECNRTIFYNLLPPHVASLFLELSSKQNSHMGLYHKSHDLIGVLFASVSNFGQFYMEAQVNNHGLECLRVLNEIIYDFDKLLDWKQFRAIDKIKTIGETYMAAIGLFPEDERSEGAKDEAKAVAGYLINLIELSFKMKGSLLEISHWAYNDFSLRTGINVGPITAGVIGASKPQYDIWGNTVNVASRMETTAEPTKIQITDEVYEMIKNADERFTYTCRGKIPVKGKGEMTTYYLEAASAEIFQELTSLEERVADGGKRAEGLPRDHSHGLPHTMQCNSGPGGYCVRCGAPSRNPDEARECKCNSST